MAEKYPDITDWKNLNKYADMFKTSESGGKGQLLDGDPSYVTNDEALVKNLKLNYKVVVGGSEAALIQASASAEKNKKPLLAYFYEPQWFFSEVPLVKVEPAAVQAEGCDADPAKVACDYPPYKLNKLSPRSSRTPARRRVDLVKNFKWTNDDQNLVSKYIAEDEMDPDDAAKKWVDANPDKVEGLAQAEPARPPALRIVPRRAWLTGAAGETHAGGCLIWRIELRITQHRSRPLGGGLHGLGPVHRPRRRDRRRHRRQQPRPPPRPARLDATSCRSTRARCPTPAARPVTPRTSSSRSTTPARSRT